LQERAGATAAEHRGTGAGAERHPHTPALASLQKHDKHEKNAHENVNDGDESDHVQEFLYFTIFKKSSAFSDAPPTSAPAMSHCDSSAAALSGLTLPPYWMRIWLAASLPSFSASRPRMKAWTSCACCGVAVRPVPMAHTGS